jgi:hypothetical protein
MTKWPVVAAAAAVPAVPAVRLLRTFAARAFADMAELPNVTTKGLILWATTRSMKPQVEE